MNKAALQALLSPMIAALGYEWWGCMLVPQAKGTLLRIYIDGAEGVTVGACATVSRQIAAALEVEGIFTGPYTLEVSSPGIYRPLFTLEHYEGYVGHPVQLRLREGAIPHRRQVRGVLKTVEGETLVVDGCDENENMVHILFQDVERGKLISGKDPVSSPQKPKSTDRK